MDDTLFEGMRDVWRSAAQRYNEHSGTRGKRSDALKELRKATTRDGADWRAIEDERRILTRLSRKGMDPSMAESLINGARSTPSLGNALLERIIRESQLTDISFLRRGAILSRGVARIELRSNAGRVLGHGTGFMVSPKLMMTNNHVLRSAGDAATAVAQFDYVSRADLAAPQPTVFEFEPQRFFKTSRLLDFTVLAVAADGSAGAKLSDRPWNSLIRESGKALVGEPVNIIQHPRGEPMQVAFRENTIVDRLEDFLHYETDTERGSSGSKACNDKWEIAALHHSGVPEMNDAGQILLDDGSIWDGGQGSIDRIKWIANEGVRISRIVAHLDGLGMSPDERRLFDACFIPMPAERLDPGREEGRSQPSDIIEENGMLRRNEPDGSVSWYFRVNFGPAGAGAPPSQSDRDGEPQAGTQANVAGQLKSDLARRRAEDLIDRFRPVDKPYFDAEKDRDDVAEYYAEIDFGAGPVALYNALNKLAVQTHETALSYKTARLMHLYPWVDLRENGDLRNVYSGVILDPAEIIAQELERFELARPGFLSDFSAEFFEDEDLDALELALETQMPFNCEHVVPQSWYQKRQPMRADLHHLFTCEPSCNSFRSNIPYFDFEPLLSESPESDHEIVRRECGQRNGDKFEPEMSHGAVARATLYFLLRYRKEIGDDAREMQKDRLSTLIDWHLADRPNRFEKHRNQAIFEIQGNRNPLIDYPEIAGDIRFERAFG